MAFAGNSILCRLALADGAIDAASFTAVRLGSGALVLLGLLIVSGQQSSLQIVREKGSWRSALALFIYALGFSYAYLTMNTATGALVLFAAVQISMLILSLLAGARLRLLQSVGMLTAFLGFAYLILPDLGTPNIWGAMMMMCAGCAWGVYSVRGMSSRNALQDSAANFVRTLPLVLLLIVASLLYTTPHFSAEGVCYALLSGGITSGLGYALWYKVLPHLNANLAAVSQLSVPIIAALGGVIFADEAITMRLMWSGAMVLGGILLVVMGRIKV
jgi:drug/metabolite transporter (DMT)-like permease